MQLSARELAAFLKGSVEGDPEVRVSRPSKIEEGGEGTISFLGNLKYEDYAYTTSASILLVDHNFQPRQSISATLIRVDNVYASIAQLLEKFGNTESEHAGISDQAFIHVSVQVGEGVSIGRFSIIESDVKIGDKTIICPQVYIGKGVAIGANVKLYPGVRILDGCQIGDGCIIHSNAVIGSDGFGFAPQEDGSYNKINQIGNVILEENVEVGANTVIDRATMGSTVIRKGVKLDNLIQIAHNVEIGQNTVLAAQVGVAGSTKLGKNCRVGGQVGFVGHVQIADGTQIQAQSGISGPVEEPNTALFGSPAINYRDFIKSFAVFKKLPTLYRKVARLERIVNDGNEN